jgi:hypothetical protein
MSETRNRREIKQKTYTKQNRKFIIFLLGVALLFFPLFAFSQGFTPQQVEISVETIVGEPTPPPPPPPPGGGVGPVPRLTKVIFKGRAYPFALLTILKNGAVAATFFAGSSGLFEKELTGITGGIYNFSIWAEDSDSRKSVTLSFTVSVISGMTTTISGIFISPTIELIPNRVERGDKVNIFGQVFPESKVNIFISSKDIVKEAIATPEGKWDFALDTTPLEIAEHYAKAQASYEDGEQSVFSQTLSFLVLKKGALVCQGADLNFDGKVNIVDFSILLYFWGQTHPSNICADINFDGIVNIIDFSIMMYYWTG